MNIPEVERRVSDDGIPQEHPMSEDFEDYLRIYVPKDLRLMDERGEGWELEALLETVEEAMQAARTAKDGTTYQLIVEVPADLDRQELDGLLDAVVSAAHAFEERFPQRTWNIHIAGGVLSEDHSPEAAFRRVFDENERLRKLFTQALKLEEDAPLEELDVMIGRAAVEHHEAAQLRRLLYKLHRNNGWPDANLTWEEKSLFSRSFDWAKREAEREEGR